MYPLIDGYVSGILSILQIRLVVLPVALVQLVVQRADLRVAQRLAQAPITRPTTQRMEVPHLSIHPLHSQLLALRAVLVPRAARPILPRAAPRLPQ